MNGKNITIENKYIGKIIKKAKSIKNNSNNNNNKEFTSYLSFSKPKKIYFNNDKNKKNIKI